PPADWFALPFPLLCTCNTPPREANWGNGWEDVTLVTALIRRIALVHARFIEHAVQEVFERVINAHVQESFALRCRSPSRADHVPTIGDFQHHDTICELIRAAPAIEAQFKLPAAQTSENLLRAVLR